MHFRSLSDCITFLSTNKQTLTLFELNCCTMCIHVPLYYTKIWIDAQCMHFIIIAGWLMAAIHCTIRVQFSQLRIRMAWPGWMRESSNSSNWLNSPTNLFNWSKQLRMDDDVSMVIGAFFNSFSPFPLSHPVLIEKLYNSSIGSKVDWTAVNLSSSLQNCNRVQ